MTSKEFVIWFRGFVQAANQYNVTPKQWDDVRDKLAQVNDDNQRTSINYTLEGNSDLSSKVLLTDHKTI